MVTSSPIPAIDPVPSFALSAKDAEVLLSLLDAPGSLTHAAQTRAVPAAELLALIANPAAHQALAHLRAFAAIRRELRADADRDELVAVLREVARLTTDLNLKRLAATAALRALDRATGRRSAAAENAACTSSSSYRSPRRVAGAPPRRVAVATSPPGSRGPQPQSVAVGDPGPSAGRSPSGGVEDPRRRGEGSFSYHSSAPHDRGDPPHPLAATHARFPVFSGQLPMASSQQPLPELDDDPEGTLAIAQHVLHAVEAGNAADFAPEVIQAARVYIDLAAPRAQEPRPP